VLELGLETLKRAVGSVPTALVYQHKGSKCFGLPDGVVDAGKTVRIAVGDGAGHGAVMAAAGAGRTAPFR
jgi:hypothetical protein